LTKRLQATQNSPHRLTRQKGCALQVGAIYPQFVCNTVYTSWRFKSFGMSTGKQLTIRNFTSRHDVTFCNYLQIDM
jgi:hypothetical protein